jgi:hypothetical protein
MDVAGRERLRAGRRGDRGSRSSGIEPRFPHELLVERLAATPKESH